MQNARKAALLARLDGLRNDRMSYEMSSSRAFTNGTIERIDNAIGLVMAELGLIEKAAA